MARLEEYGIANRQIVGEGVERLRRAYEEFIHEKQAAGYQFKFIDGQMIGHNFYKLIMHHIADEIVDRKDIPAAERIQGEVFRYFVQIAIATLQKVLDKPITNENDPELM